MGACKTNKVSYSSKKFADDDIKRFSTSDRAKKPINSYLCHYCNTWHLTSRPDVEQVQKLVDELRAMTTDYNKLKKDYDKLLKQTEKAALQAKVNDKTFVYSIKYYLVDSKKHETQMMSFEAPNEVEARKLAQKLMPCTSSVKLMGVIDKKIQENLAQL